MTESGAAQLRSVAMRVADWFTCFQRGILSMLRTLCERERHVLPAPHLLSELS